MWNTSIQVSKQSGRAYFNGQRNTNKFYPKRKLTLGSIVKSSGIRFCNRRTSAKLLNNTWKKKKKNTKEEEKTHALRKHNFLWRIILLKDRTRSHIYHNQIPVLYNLFPIYVGLNYKQPLSAMRITGLHVYWDILKIGGSWQHTLELSPLATPVAPSKNFHSI